MLPILVSITAWVTACACTESESARAHRVSLYGFFHMSSRMMYCENGILTLFRVKSIKTCKIFQAKNIRQSNQAVWKGIKQILALYHSLSDGLLLRSNRNQIRNPTPLSANKCAAYRRRRSCGRIGRVAPASSFCWTGFLPSCWRSVCFCPAWFCSARYVNQSVDGKAYCFCVSW